MPACKADLTQFVKDEFNVFLECGILARGFPVLRCGDCALTSSLASRCKRRKVCTSHGARRMAQTATHHVDHALPHAPVCTWVPSLPTTLRLLLAAQPRLVAPALRAVHRAITQCLLGQTRATRQTRPATARPR